MITDISGDLLPFKVEIMSVISVSIMGSKNNGKELTLIAFKFIDRKIIGKSGILSANLLPSIFSLAIFYII